MSGQPQGRKGLTSKQRFCAKKKFNSKDEAKASIQSLRDSGMRGTARLHAYKCPTCSRKKKDVIHVGHRRPV